MHTTITYRWVRRHWAPVLLWCVRSYVHYTYITCTLNSRDRKLKPLSHCHEFGLRVRFHNLYSFYIIHWNWYPVIAMECVLIRYEHTSRGRGGLISALVTTSSPRLLRRGLDVVTSSQISPSRLPNDTVCTQSEYNQWAQLDRFHVKTRQIVLQLTWKWH